MEQRAKGDSARATVDFGAPSPKYLAWRLAPQVSRYGLGDGDGEAAGLVVDFFVVVSFFAVVSFLVLVVAPLGVVGVVVVDSFWLAHDVIKPKAAKTAMDVISDCFIG